MGLAGQAPAEIMGRRGGGGRPGEPRARLCRSPRKILPSHTESAFPILNRGSISATRYFCGCLACRLHGLGYGG